MELKNVKVVSRKQPEGGVGKNGNAWTKQTVIVEEIDNKYPKPIALTMWNDQVSAMESINDGEIMDCKIRVESREYNEKWYTDVVCWSVSSNGSSEKPASKETAKKENDLPF